MPHRPATKGFTLLELMVAVTILAIIGVGSYRLLSSTVTTRDAATAHDAQLMQLQKAMQIMQRDIEQTIARPVRDEYGDAQPALYFPKDNVLEFTRTGWRNPMGEARSEMARVRYVVEAGHLRRYQWTSLDRLQGAEPQVNDLLGNVTDWHVRAMDSTSAWTGNWPPVSSSQQDKAKAPLPRAIEVTFSAAPYGNLRRVFRIVQGGVSAQSTNP